jgi:glycosyltransferase A (GT-A) superfamily protein (DUF2064 family)
VTTLVLIAKEPLAGRAKTRLSPPLTLEQAARLAAACIDDTIAAMAALPVSRRVLLFEGERIPDSAAAFEVIRQVAGGLDERLAALFDASSGPTLLIGMDTPQLRAAELAPALAWPSGVDVWFGPASDGGYWAIGMREPRGDVIRGVPMSRHDTAEHQLRRLRDAGLSVGMLPVLTDVDTIADARRVAEATPHTRFARLLNEFERAPVGAVPRPA